MSLKNIAVDGWEWEFSTGEGDIEVTGGLSDKFKCDGKKAFVDKISFVISNYSGQGISLGSGTGEIKGSSKKLKIFGSSSLKSVVLEGDESEGISVTGLNEAPPPPSKTVTVKVKVKKAGQTKVKAE